MASIIEQHSSDGACVEISVTGALRHQELLDYAEHEGHDKCVMPTIWDLRNANWQEIPREFLLSNFEVARKFGKSGHKTAFIFNPESGRALIRMLEQYTAVGAHSPTYRAFTNLDEARSWIGQGSLISAAPPPVGQQPPGARG